MYAAGKQSPEGIWKESYKNWRTSRSQSAALTDDGTQGRAEHQETSVLSIALFVTQCMTLGYLLNSSRLSFILDKMGPGLAANTWRVDCGAAIPTDSHIWETSSSHSLQPKVNPFHSEKWVFHSLTTLVSADITTPMKKLVSFPNIFSCH